MDSRYSEWMMRSVVKLLSLLLVFASSGCFVSVPTPHSTPFKKYARNSANEPIQLNTTTKDAARAKIGIPTFHSEDDTVWLYSKDVIDSIGLWLPIIIPVHGGSIQPETNEYRLYLIFDANDVVSDYAVFMPDGEIRAQTSGPDTPERRAELRDLDTQHMFPYKSP